MNPRTVLAGLTLLLCANAVAARGAFLPSTLDASPCRTPPTIDGAIGEAEWQDARPYKIDLTVARLGQTAVETRPCTLRVMNSANALYVAFQVPDATIDDSLAPLVIDVATLAFCQGEKVRPGDDRKAIAAGAYRDKFVEVPGKGDKDDPKQDGRGAMERDNGICTFEWALPLSTGDTHDLNVKPGESVRFNVVYFDAFQFPLTKTRFGGTYGAQLDRADAWGTLRLAANVKDDGGAAFAGPAWLEPRLKESAAGPAARLRVTETKTPAGSTTAMALVDFTYRDEHGQTKEAKAKLYLPDRLKKGRDVKVPLLFAAGYEMPDGGEQPFVRRGWAVASPRALAVNPLVRTANPDIALLHAVRAFRFVDDTRVLIAGGSAGGYMTLMLAAETFPLAGASADLPPVNFGYNVAYFFKQTAAGTVTDKLPGPFAVARMLQGCNTVYGENYDDPIWFAHSPLAHVPTITAPVSVYWSTADMLVPMNQVGARWVQPFDNTRFPQGFTMDPAQLLKGKEGRITLTDVVPERDVEIFPLAVPSPATGPIKLPASAERLWSVGILDEGPPEPTVVHRKTTVPLDRSAFYDRVLTGKVPARQLNAAKLERLMDRYAGREWLRSRLQHLDIPASEQTDVLRGLRTYVAAGPENARTFAALYAQLPAAKRALEPDIVHELSRSGGKPASGDR